MFSFGVEQYKFSENKTINSIILYVLIFFTIAFSRDTLYSYAKFNFYITFFSYLIIFFILLTTIFFKYFKSKFVFRKKATLFIGINIFCILTSTVIKLDFRLYVLSILLYMDVAYFCIHIFTFDDFFKKYSNIICFLAVYSLICCYVIRPFLFSNSNHLPVVSNSANLQFFDLIFDFVVVTKSYLRNFGIFREPGVYALFINIALLYELLFLKGKYRYLHILILFITCVSTFSIPSIAVSVLFIIVSFFKAIVGKRISKYELIFIFTSLFICLLSFIVMCFINEHLYILTTQMLKKMVTSNESMLARTTAITKDIKLFIHSPIWGNRFSAVLSDSSYSIACTFGLFALFGLLGGVFHIISFWLVAQKASDKILMHLIIFGLVLLMFNTQFIIGNPIFWIFSFSIFMLRDEENDEKNQIDIIFVFKLWIQKIKSIFLKI